MSSIKKNFIYNIAYQVLIMITPFITAPYISRVFGKEGVGIFSYANSVAYYFLIFSMLGIANEGSRAIARERDNQERVNEIFSGLYFIQFFMFIVVSLAYVMYLMFFCKDYKLVAGIMYIYIASGVLDISWLFFGFEDFKITVLRNALIKILTVIAVFIFVKSINDVYIYAFIMAIGTFLSQAYLWVYRRKYASFVKVNYWEVKKHIVPVLILFIPTIAASIYKIMDKIMIGNISEYAELGLYEYSEKIVSIPQSFITAFGTVMFPRMSYLLKDGDTEKSNRYVLLSFQIVSLIGSAVVFGLMGVSKTFPVLFLGSEYAECSKIVFGLAITVIFVAWADITRRQYLIPKGRDMTYVVCTILAACINLIVNMLLIPKYGAMGAVVGTIIAEGLLFLLQLFIIKNNLPIIQYIIKCVPFLFSGVLMMILVYKIGLVMALSWATLIIQIAVGGVVYIVMVTLFMKQLKMEVYEIIVQQIKFVFGRLYHNN